MNEKITWHCILLNWPQLITREEFNVETPWQSNHLDESWQITFDAEDSTSF